MEILAPSGSPSAFFAAVNAECDAVYLGLDNFSARKNADNFNVENLSYYTAYAHIFNIKVYVCINTLIKDSELFELFETVEKAIISGVDAFIVQDIFIGKALSDAFPQIVLHLSTQAGVNNVYGARQAIEYGFSRVVLARETSLSDVKEIAKIIDTEVFVQGALCTCFSGHCYLSAFIGGQSGNRGLCRQPCRQKYAYLSQNEQNYALSLADLCLLDKLDELEKIGVKSIKIEGRMRSAEYVFSAVKLYKNKLACGNVDKSAIVDLKKCFNRGDYTVGYMFGEDKKLFSREVASHLGVLVGRVAEVTKYGVLVGGASFLKGDGFKLFRNGKEIGGAVAQEDGNVIKTSAPCKIGDEVRITKDASQAKSLAEMKRLKPISIKAEFISGKKAVLSALGVMVYSEEPLDTAENSAVTLEEITKNLNKTDVYPFMADKIEFVSDGKAFLPKSKQNQLRKSLYESIFYGKKVEINSIPYDIKALLKAKKNTVKNEIAVITSSENFIADARITRLIFAPKCYNVATVEGFLSKVGFGVKKYLYLPAFLPEEQFDLIRKIASGFDGIYGEGLYALAFAREINIEFFGGVELNIYNKIDENCAKNICSEFCISKELSLSESENYEGFRLVLGSAKVMSLMYCPFGRSCDGCKKGDLLSITDYGGRVFPIRRYRLGVCRFEMYNERIICASKPLDKMLFDLSGLSDIEGQKLIECYFKGGFDLVKESYKCNLGRLVKGVD